MDVSIIIVNYHSSDLINNCIDSIFEKVSGVSYEIIIVDNATENLTESIKSAADSRVKLIQLHENIGFGMANNAGFEIAAGRNIFFLNPDTLMINNAVGILSDYLDEHPKTGAVGGNVYNSSHHPIISFSRHYPGIYEETNLLFHNALNRLFNPRSYYFNNSGKPMNVCWITGADLMIPASVIKATGGFSKAFFMYFEEVDLCHRINILGKKIVSVPDAEITHLVDATPKSSEVNLKVLKAWQESRLNYLKLNVRRWKIPVCNMLYSLHLHYKKIFHPCEINKLRLKLYREAVENSTAP